ncbi:MAG: transposase [Phycisphaerales bacterium]
MGRCSHSPPARARRPSRSRSRGNSSAHAGTCRIGSGVDPGYLLADTAFDWDTLHTQCSQRDVRLLAPRRPSRWGKGLRRQASRVGAARRACVAAMETPHAHFARDLHSLRPVVERVFARLETRWRIGHPPFYVRRLARVRLWVHTALILDHFLQRQAA